MSMNNRKIAGFMSAESIYSLAFYIVMVAAIAGVGASVLSNKDSAKAAAAISLLRANVVAESAGLGYTPAADAAAIVRMSGNLLVLATNAILPGGAGTVTIVPRTGGTAPNGFAINIVGIAKPAICNAVAGVGYGTWAGLTTTIPSGHAAAVTVASKPALKATCDAATTAAAVSLYMVSE